VGSAQGSHLQPGGYAGGALNPLNWRRWVLTGDANAPDEVYQEAYVGLGAQLDENVVPVASAGAEGLTTGGKAVVNGAAQAGVDLLSLGLYEGKVEVFQVTELDRAYGYDLSAAFARGGVTVIMAVGTGGLQSVLSKGGSLARAASGALNVFDAAGNLVGVIQGSEDMLQNGPSVGAGIRVVSSGLGLAANVNAFARAADDVPNTAPPTAGPPKGVSGPRTIDPSTLPLPPGMKNNPFGELVNWPRGPGDAAAKMGMAQDALNQVTPEFINALGEKGVTPEMLQRWAEFYRAEAIRVPQNPTATARAFYLEELIKLMKGQ
jgi:hypothetical protein